MATSNPINAPPIVEEEAHQPNRFNKLPIETVQHIASYVLEDDLLCNFRLACQAMHNAVDADNCSFWRRRFLSRFEKPADADSEGWKGAKGNVRFREAYQKRRWVMKNGASSFVTGDTAREEKCLEVLRDLVVGTSPLLPTFYFLVRVKCR